MIHDNAIVGAPLTLYKDTKANEQIMKVEQKDE